MSDFTGLFGGGGLPIGATMYMAPSGDNTVQLGDSTIWLSTGVLALASAYPDAAKLPHLAAHGFTAAGGVTVQGNNNCKIATNGAGVYVIADWYGSNLKVSTNYGANWSNVNQSPAGNVTDVIWDPVSSQFLAVSNSTTTVYLHRSSNGTAWTTSNFTASATAGTARICAAAGYYVIAVKGSSVSNSVLTSIGTNPSTGWTFRNIPYVFSGQPVLGGGAGKVVISSLDYASAASMSFTADGINFTAPAAPPASSANSDIFYFAGKFGYFTPTQVVWTTDPNNWPSANVFNLPLGISPSTAPGQINWLIYGGRLILPSVTSVGYRDGLAYTDDLNTWGIQSTNISLGGAIAMDANTIVCAPKASAAQAVFAVSSFANPNRVGIANLAATGSGSVGSAMAILYYRIK